MGCDSDTVLRAVEDIVEMGGGAEPVNASGLQKLVARESLLLVGVVWGAEGEKVT